MTDTIDGKKTATAFGVSRVLAEMTDSAEEDQARRLVREEYGDSENFMTPTVAGYMMLGPDVAAEVAIGSGLRRPDTGERPMIVGISIVRRLEDGSTERLTWSQDERGGHQCLVAPTLEDVRDKLESLREKFGV